MAVETVMIYLSLVYGSSAFMTSLAFEILDAVMIAAVMILVY